MPVGRTSGSPPPSSRDAAAPAASSVVGDRPLPGQQRAAGAEQRQRVLGQHGQRGARARRDQVLGLAQLATAERLRAVRERGHVREAERRDERAQGLDLLPDRVDEGPRPPRVARVPARCRARRRRSRGRGRAADRPRPAAAKRARASSRCSRATSSGSTTRVRFSRRLASSSRPDVALGGIGEARWQLVSKGGRLGVDQAVEGDASGAGGVIGLQTRNAPPGGLSVFPRLIGVAARLSHEPRPAAVTVLGRPQKQDGEGSSPPCCGPQPEFSTNRANRGSLWISRPDILSPDGVRTPAAGYDRGPVADHVTSALATPLRARQRGGAGEDPRLLRCRVAIRTRRLPHLLERRRRGHRVVRARLLPAGDRPATSS